MSNINKVLETVFGPLDPAPEFKFYLEIDGLVEGAFAECSGMKADREIITVKEGGLNHYAHKLPGRVTYGDITLRKGVMFTIELWDWFEKGYKKGDVKKRDFTIYQHSSYFNIPLRWYHVKDAYPISWEASSLRTDSNQLSMESLTLTFDKLEPEEWSLLGIMAKMLV
jgi:phage tail-like protein